MTDGQVVRRRNEPATGHPTEPPRPRVPRQVYSYAQGRHLPDPRMVDGTWRCTACWHRLRWYQTDRLEWRLRHYRP